MRPQDAVERALEVARGRCDDCVVIVQESSNANLRWAGNTLTTNGVTRSRTLTVVAVVGEAVGVVTRSAVTRDELPDVVEAAARTATDNAPAEDFGPLVDGRTSPDWDTPPGETSAQVFTEFAPALGEAFGRARSAGHGLYGYAEHDLATTYLGSSAGLRLRHQQPDGRVELTGRTPDGERSSWTGQATRDFTDVDVAGLASTLDRRLGWATRRLDLPAGRYETLLPSSAVGDLMVLLYWSAGALDAHEGQTVFSRPHSGTRVGETLCAAPVRLRSDPALPGFESAPFVVAPASSRLSSVFDNGMALTATDWVREGRLEALLGTRHSERRTGVPARPWVDNLVFDSPGGAGSIDDMVAASGRALLLTSLWYIREVDPQTLLLTGLTRDGVFLVEDGEVVGAVNNFRFNESPVDMLGRLLEIGTAVPGLPRELGDYFTGSVMAPVRVADFNMSSVSQAS